MNKMKFKSYKCPYAVTLIDCFKLQILDNRMKFATTKICCFAVTVAVSVNYLNVYINCVFLL